MRTSEKIVLEKMNYISVSQYSSHSDFSPIASVPMYTFCTKGRHHIVVLCTSSERDLFHHVIAMT